MKLRRPELEWLNEEKIPDPTAYEAFSHRREREKAILEMARLKKAMAEVRQVLAKYGFIQMQRIKIKSTRTGNVYE